MTNIRIYQQFRVWHKEGDRVTIKRGRRQRFVREWHAFEVDDCVGKEKKSYHNHYRRYNLFQRGDIILKSIKFFKKLLTPPATQPHGSQGCVHFEGVHDIACSNFAYYSFCSRIGEMWMKNTYINFFHSRYKPTLTSVEFTFNASVISLTTLSPISLSVSQQKNSHSLSGKLIVPNTN